MDKKLIYILNSYSSQSSQHFYHVINLLKEMASKGVDIVLVIEKATDYPKVDDRIKIIVQKETGIRRVIELHRILKKYIKLGYRKIFVRISLNASVVAILSSLGTKAEVYFWQSGDNLTYDRQKKGKDKIKWYFSNYSKLWFTKTFGDYFVTGPETMVEYYEKELKVKRNKLICLYNDIDINRFVKGTSNDRLELRKELGISADSKIVLFVHRLTPVKRFSRLIPAIAECEDTRKNGIYYVIIGCGPEEEIIRNSVANSQYKDRLLLLGPRPNAEVQKYYAGADVFINPSYSEGFPRVVIEAMSAGLPVVVTDVGGTRDILPDIEQEYLIDKDDVVKFREKVIDLIRDDEKREVISKVNIDYVKRFSTEMVAQQYISQIWR